MQKVNNAAIRGSMLNLVFVHFFVTTSLLYMSLYKLNRTLKCSFVVWWYFTLSLIMLIYPVYLINTFHHIKS